MSLIVNMRSYDIFALAALAARNAYASLSQKLKARGLTPEQCSNLLVVFTVPQSLKATSFCSSFVFSNLPLLRQT